MTCQFPNCSRNAEKNGYCIGHRSFASFTPGKAAKKPNDKSDTRKQEEKEYKKIVKEMLSKNNNCTIKSPVCTKAAEGLHHMKKRTGKNYLDKKYLKPSCNACNQYCETHPQWAIENGHSISKFKPEVIVAEHDQEVNAIIVQS